MKTKVNKNAHASNAKYGMGDYTGTAVKNKVGKIRDVYSISPMAKQQSFNKKTSMA